MIFLINFLNLWMCIFSTWPISKIRQYACSGSNWRGILPNTVFKGVLFNQWVIMVPIECLFNQSIKHHDKVYLPLYKQTYPKFVSENIPLEDVDVSYTKGGDAIHKIKIMHGGYIVGYFWIETIYCEGIVMSMWWILRLDYAMKNSYLIPVSMFLQKNNECMLEITTKSY